MENKFCFIVLLSLLCFLGVLSCHFFCVVCLLGFGNLADLRMSQTPARSANMANKVKTHVLENISLPSILKPAGPAPHVAGTKGSPLQTCASAPQPLKRVGMVVSAMVYVYCWTQVTCKTHLEDMLYQSLTG